MNTQQTAEPAAAEYRHFDKVIEPGEGVTLDSSRLKWHDLADPAMPIPEDIKELARDFLERRSAADMRGELGELGFVILHRCGQGFYFLLVNTWRNDNELWESVYAKQTTEQKDFEEFRVADHHRPTFCVWELAAVWHEQQAWKRYLLSQRDEAAREAYLKDGYRGPA